MQKITRLPLSILSTFFKYSKLSIVEESEGKGRFKKEEAANIENSQELSSRGIEKPLFFLAFVILLVVYFFIKTGSLFKLEPDPFNEWGVND